MIIVGIDLAWSEKNGTGLCVAEGGRVIDSGFVRSNVEIQNWLSEWAGEPLVAAVDAPLIMTNDSGSRACEKIVTKWMGGRHAGAHSSNLSQPAFSGGPRAERIAKGLECSTDPARGPGSGDRQMIEVYPHPALVALFSLPVTLKYKNKTGRTIEDRQAEFERLAECLESLTNAFVPFDVRCERWRQIVRELQRATKHVELDRLEDEIDAYVCAYVAHLWQKLGPPEVQVVGDARQGYIVSPVCDSAGRVEPELSRLQKARSAVTSSGV